MVNEKRLIDAKPLMENGWHLVKTGESNVFLASMSLADAPTVDAVEVVHGRWQERRFICMDSEVMLGYRCSRCSLTFDAETNYCPNCGAKMDGGNKDG